MINIVHTEINSDDNRQITSIELKLKYIVNEDEKVPSSHIFVATASAAFYKTTLFADVGKTPKTVLNPNRPNIINLTINFADNNSLKLQDIANFVEAFQTALDNTSLIF